MAQTVSQSSSANPATAGRAEPLSDLLPLCAEALEPAERLVDAARAAMTGLVGAEAGIDPAKLEEHQFAAHGYAWLATYGAALREMLAWARRLEADGKLGEPGK